MKLPRYHVILLIPMFVVVTRTTLAHDARPVVIHVQEQEEGIRVDWRIPKVAGMIGLPALAVPPSCQAHDEPIRLERTDSIAFSGQFRCGPDWMHEAFGLNYPGDANPGLSTLFRLTALEGESQARLFAPDQSAFDPQSVRTGKTKSAGFLRLGIHHILVGFDHLLFVLCLLLISETWRRVLFSVTGFTLAHSVTLGLSTLGVMDLPVRSVETCIALSVVFLAAEIARGNRETLSYRYPVVVATLFGLLHGFGFASVLSTTGLSRGETLQGLLFFNLGVEIGQLLFIGLVGIVWTFLNRLLNALVREQGISTAALRLERPLAYAVGLIAVVWTVNRIVA